MLQRPTHAMILTALATTGLLSRAVLAQSTPRTDPRAARCFAERFGAQVRGAISGYADIARIPGVSIGVVVKDALVYAGGVGSANKRTRVPATADTPCNVASVTKVFTATLAVQLAAEGRLDLDAPVTRYLPASVRVPQDTTGHSIATRHLLTHSARLPTNPRWSQPIDGSIEAGV